MRSLVTTLAVLLIPVGCAPAEEIGVPISGPTGEGPAAETWARRSLEPPYDPTNTSPRYEGSGAEAVGLLGLEQALVSWPDPGSETFAEDLMRDLRQLEAATDWLDRFRTSREGQPDELFAASLVGTAGAHVDHARDGIEGMMRFIREEKPDLARQYFAIRKNVGIRLQYELERLSETHED